MTRKISSINSLPQSKVLDHHTNRAKSGEEDTGETRETAGQCVRCRLANRQQGLEVDPMTTMHISLFQWQDYSSPDSLRAEFLMHADMRPAGSTKVSSLLRCVHPQWGARRHSFLLIAPPRCLGQELAPFKHNLDLVGQSCRSLVRIGPLNTSIRQDLAMGHISPTRT